MLRARDSIPSIYMLGATTYIFEVICLFSIEVGWHCHRHDEGIVALPRVGK
jgi:hypothetical protein